MVSRTAGFARFFPSFLCKRKTGSTLSLTIAMNFQQRHPTTATPQQWWRWWRRRRRRRQQRHWRRRRRRRQQRWEQAKSTYQNFSGQIPKHTYTTTYNCPSRKENSNITTLYINRHIKTPKYTGTRRHGQHRHTLIHTHARTHIHRFRIPRDFNSDRYKRTKTKSRDTKNVSKIPFGNEISMLFLR